MSGIKFTFALYPKRVHKIDTMKHYLLNLELFLLNESYTDLYITSILLKHTYENLNVMMIKYI